MLRPILNQLHAHSIPHVTESIAEYLRDDSCCSMWGQDLLAFMLTSKDCFVAAVPVAYRRYLVTNEFLPPLNFAKVTETGVSQPGEGH
jgi:hypothetical protein